MTGRLTVLVTGARDWTDKRIIETILIGLRFRVLSLTSFEILVGDCPTGADAWTRSTAQSNAWSYRVFTARWNEMAAEGKPRRAAGPLRNTEMLDALQAAEGDKLVVAFHDDLDNSRGTGGCVRDAKKRDLLVYLVTRP